MKNLPRRQRGKRKFDEDFVVGDFPGKRTKPHDRKKPTNGEREESIPVPQNKKATIRDKCDLEAVVVLHNIFEGVTISHLAAKNGKKREKGIEKQKFSGSRQAIIVPLVDCLKLKRSTSRKTPASLEHRGLQDVKLSEIKFQSPAAVTTVITSQIVTQLLVNAVTLGNAPNRINRPFDLATAKEECAAIVEALSLYTARVDPEESYNLYCITYHHRDSSVPDDKASYLPNNVNRRSPDKGGPAPRRQPNRKNWIYVSTLGTSDYFLKMKLLPGAPEAFETKMVDIMKAGLRVDSYNWTLSEVGYIFGFWLAKLYKSFGYAEEHLPREVVWAKEQFLQLYGFQYDHAKVLLT